MGAGSHWHWALECSALLINHNQSCAITSIFLVNYCEGQVVQLRTRAPGMRVLEKHLALQNPEKEQGKGKNAHRKKYLYCKYTCMHAVFPNTRDVGSLIPYNNKTRDAAPSQRVNTVGKGRTYETHNLFPAVKMKSRNTKTMRSYDYDLLLLGCKIQAWLLTRHKNVFPKVSIQ